MGPVARVPCQVLQRRAAPLVEARKAQEALHSAPDEEKVQLESAAKATGGACQGCCLSRNIEIGFVVFVIH